MPNDQNSGDANGACVGPFIQGRNGNSTTFKLVTEATATDSPNEAEISEAACGLYFIVNDYPGGGHSNWLGPVTCTPLATPAPAAAPVQPPQLLSLALNLALNATLPSGSTILSGSGLQPNSQYTLTLRSDPVLLFTGTSDPNGNFKSAFDLGSVTCPAPGAHTLTLAGVRPDGSETSAVAAFSIDAGCKVTNIVRDGYGQDALANVYFASGSSKLSKAAKGKIEAAVKANPSAIYRVIGYVQKSGSSSNDEKLSLARARSVEKYLVSLGAGVNFTVVSESGLISPQNGKSVKARKATLFALTPVVL